MWFAGWGTAIFLSFIPSLSFICTAWTVTIWSEVWRLVTHSFIRVEQNVPFHIQSPVLSNNDVLTTATGQEQTGQECWVNPGFVSLQDLPCQGQGRRSRPVLPGLQQRVQHRQGGGPRALPLLHPARYSSESWTWTSVTAAWLSSVLGCWSWVEEVLHKDSVLYEDLKKGPSHWGCRSISGSLRIRPAHTGLSASGVPPHFCLLFSELSSSKIQIDPCW